MPKSELTEAIQSIMVRLRTVVCTAVSLLLVACGGEGGGGADIPRLLETGSIRDAATPITRAEISEFTCPGGIHNGVDTIESAEYLGRPAERLTYIMGSGAKSVAYRFNAGRDSVVYHSGHNGYVRETFINRLLHADFTVVIFHMPLVNENTGPWTSHDDIANLCPFVEPVIRFLNQYGPAHLVGFSGGGWTTVLAAAIDDRIIKSFSVSGSLPYDLRGRKEDYGDFEQQELNRFADYREIYALANHQVAVQNRFDSCCFSGTGLMEIDIPGWRAVLDETHRQHIISDFAVEVILDELTKDVSP
jgi:pimeloyl-ACP methyl ester carboxylesterase